MASPEIIVAWLKEAGARARAYQVEDQVLANTERFKSRGLHPSTVCRSSVNQLPMTISIGTIIAADHARSLPGSPFPQWGFH